MIVIHVVVAMIPSDIDERVKKVFVFTIMSCLLFNECFFINLKPLGGKAKLYIPNSKVS